MRYQGDMVDLPTRLAPAALRPLRLPRWGALLLAVLLAAVIVVPGRERLARVALQEAESRGQNTLRLAVAGLRGELARFERLPQLIAQQDRIAEAVRPDAPPSSLDLANRYLNEVNRLLGSSDIYVMRPDGRTVAASNFNQPAPFNGQNFGYRPYFTEALAGGEGRFFGLGTTSRKRGYYFGAPIRREGAILGVVALKIDVDALEDSWRAADYEIIVTDPQGIVFMASRRAWHFGTLAPLTEAAQAEVAATRRYDGNPLTPLPLTAAGAFQGHDLLRLTEATGSREFMVLSEEMPLAGWSVNVLMDTASARAQVWTGTLSALLAVGLAVLGLAVYLQRRGRMHERLQMQREAQAQLEHRVAERTRELDELNARLRGEVAERRATEAELRRTHSRLIQSGKLAALGQMSAALSHEFNQPLGALRNFADNALAYIDRGRVPEARENIGRIQGLVERMSGISRTLRNFARKPNRHLGAVDVHAVWADAREVIDWRLRGTGVALEVDLGPPPLQVQGGPVRLQQVLVNLVTNAIDSLEGRADGRVIVAAAAEAGAELGDRVRITVTDNGPGVAPGLAERIFDPFFTTKGVGRGLGLGLSISYNIVKDFGGDLRVTDAPGGGACFEIVLPVPAVGCLPAEEGDEDMGAA